MTYVRQPKLPKYVYFLRRKEGIGPIKVGCSRLPLVRLREFYRWSPYELELLVTAPGGHDMECALHHLFATDRLHMEWFAPSEPLLSLINDIGRGAALDQAIARVVPARASA